MFAYFDNFLVYNYFLHREVNGKMFWFKYLSALTQNIFFYRLFFNQSFTDREKTFFVTLNFENLLFNFLKELKSFKLIFKKVQNLEVG